MIGDLFQPVLDFFNMLIEPIKFIFDMIGDAIETFISVIGYLVVSVNGVVSLHALILPPFIRSVFLVAILLGVAMVFVSIFIKGHSGGGS